MAKKQITPVKTEPTLRSVDSHKSSTMVIVAMIFIVLLLNIAMIYRFQDFTKSTNVRLTALETKSAMVASDLRDTADNVDQIAQAAGGLFQKQGYAIAAIAYRTEQIQNATGLSNKFGPMFPAFENQTATN